jgi:ADP-ribosylglycohydrolase
MDWFESLTGFRETNYDDTRARLKVEDRRLRSLINGLLETVSTVLHILMRHAGDPEEAIIRAVNDTKDNDTIAAIVGAAVGALHGLRAVT